MAKFILGYKDTCETVTVDGRNLTLFTTKAEADYESEEWCEVEATTEDEARGKYEEARVEWLQSEEFNNPTNSIHKDRVTRVLVQFEYFLERELHILTETEAVLVLQKIAEKATAKSKSPF